jgi:DNA processing protein
MEETARIPDHSHVLAVLRAPAAPRTLRRLIAAFGTSAGLLSASRDELVAAGARSELLEYLRSPDWRGVEYDLRWLERGGNALLTLDSPDYPELLRQIADPPLALFVRGDASVLSRVQLAIVGSRTPTADGRRLARSFATQAVQSGLVVTSGLALGIDGEAHAGALAAAGRTVAVLGNGQGTVYPRRHAVLAEQIADGGAVISEFPTDVAPLPENFPRRNRVISGVSSGVLVVEAALRSGSLITANHALEQGREVFAVPGPVQNSRARGCHALIRQGAKLVEEIGDVLEEIWPVAAVARSTCTEARCDAVPAKALDGNSKLLLHYIGHQPVSFDDLVEATEIPVGIAASLLSSLEIAGMIESLPGGNYVRRRPA